MSNIVEPQITETKPSKFYNSAWEEALKNSIPFVPPNIQKPIVGKPDLTAQQKAQYEIARQQAQQQAIIQEMTPYSGLTDKVFGKSKQGWGLDPQRLRIGAYIIVGAVVGRYVAKNMAKSTTLGMIVGGLAPLLVLKLTMEYDKKNMPKQEPKQKVAIQPTPTQNKSKTYSKECMDSLNERLMQKDVKKPNFQNDFLENCAKNEKNNNYGK